MTARLIQMKTTSTRVPEINRDDDVSIVSTFMWCSRLVVPVCIALVLVDHHATLRFATPMGSVRPLREIAVVLFEVALIFLCFVAFFTLAVHPIFNHTVTFRLHQLFVSIYIFGFRGAGA